ncbi:MAG TPA: HYD1 signature containing ADP-ribosyltransferase family protein, partial [Tepidisphaeraceae bacterium]|nr:HYD1 signature containing ADP-ribosyltransferase family protein [Tepidisphaeraceae bacterium]
AAAGDHRGMLAMGPVANDWDYYQTMAQALADANARDGYVAIPSDLRGDLGLGGPPAVDLLDPWLYLSEEERAARTAPLDDPLRPVKVIRRDRSYLWGWGGFAGADETHVLPDGTEVWKPIDRANYSTQAGVLIGAGSVRTVFQNVGETLAEEAVQATTGLPVPVPAGNPFSRLPPRRGMIALPGSSVSVPQSAFTETPVTFTVKGNPVRYDLKSLYHYTNEAGMNGIVSSGELRPSLWYVGTKDVRYGNGQYLSDIVPGSRTPIQLAREFIRTPNKYRFTNYVEVNVGGLRVIQGADRPSVFVVPNSSSLDVSTRIISSGKVTTP